MPSTSAKQHRFMEAASHDPAFAKRAGIPQSVAAEYVAADAAKGAGTAELHRKRQSGPAGTNALMGKH